MPRPRKCRRVNRSIRPHFFKPNGVPMRNLDVIELSQEEAYALRLKNISGLDQNECAKKMNTSQSTFQRILSSANYKVSYALLNGLAIMIEGK